MRENEADNTNSVMELLFSRYYTMERNDQNGKRKYNRRAPRYVKHFDSKTVDWIFKLDLKSSGGVYRTQLRQEMNHFDDWEENISSQPSNLKKNRVGLPPNDAIFVDLL